MGINGKKRSLVNLQNPLSRKWWTSYKRRIFKWNFCLKFDL